MRRDGIVKVLDFGLAKVEAPEPVARDVSDSPTMTMPEITQTGNESGCRQREPVTPSTDRAY